jgi:FlgD Ig-like domain
VRHFLLASLATLALAPCANAGIGPVDPTGLYAVTHVRPVTFYPYVNDKYRDVTLVDVSVEDTDEGNDPLGYHFADGNVCASGSTYTVTTTIRNTDGYVVRKLVSTHHYGYFTLKWDGRRTSGKLVHVGKYHVNLDVNATCIEAYDPWGIDDVVLATNPAANDVYVARGFKWFREKKTVWGRKAESHWATGACASSPDGYGWLLNCSKVSGSAGATWNIAPKTPWKHATVYFPDSQHDGPVNGSKSRVGDRLFVQLAVPGYAWSYVDRLHVVYKHKRTI